MLRVLNSRCNAGPFDTAAELKDHLRRKHELFYCDICMQHLKVEFFFFITSIHPTGQINTMYDVFF